MRTVFFLAAITMAFTVEAQTIDKPIVLKSFDKDQDHNVWYTSKQADEQNIRRIMYSTEGNEEYYKYILELFDFDPEQAPIVDGTVMIFEDDNYNIRVIEKKYTIISVTKY
jgi:hypothetical protein